MHALRISAIALLLVSIVTATSAQVTGPTNRILIPAAGDLEGSNGTHFRSDITVTNFRNVDQRALFTWVPNPDFLFPFSIDPPPPQSITLIIPAASSIGSENFAGERIMSIWRLGALLVTGVTASGDSDPGALLQATERIWTPQPGSTGTTSQSVPVVDANQLKGGAQALITGQRIDERFHSNVGIVNLDPGSTRTFDIYENSDNPTLVPIVTTVIVGPMSMKQVALQYTVAKVLQITVVPRDGNSSAPWIAYGSSVDNVTGDSWSNLALPR